MQHQDTSYLTRPACTQGSFLLSPSQEVSNQELSEFMVRDAYSSVVISFYDEFMHTIWTKLWRAGALWWCFAGKQGVQKSNGMVSSSLPFPYCVVGHHTLSSLSFTLSYHCRSVWKTTYIIWYITIATRQGVSTVTTIALSTPWQKMIQSAIHLVYYAAESLVANTPIHGLFFFTSQCISPFDSPFRVYVRATDWPILFTSVWSSRKKNHP